MRRLSPTMAMRIGFVVLFVAILVTITRPGGGDLVDSLKGFAIGVGFGLVLAGFVKKRASAAER